MFPVPNNLTIYWAFVHDSISCPFAHLKCFRSGNVNRFNLAGNPLLKETVINEGITEPSMNLVQI
jgi:hypothetical protein